MTAAPGYKLKFNLLAGNEATHRLLFDGRLMHDDISPAAGGLYETVTPVSIEP